MNNIDRQNTKILSIVANGTTSFHIIKSSTARPKKLIEKPQAKQGNIEQP